ncbi:hypothetical protein D3C80_1670670 [compost metagenome]
MTEQVADAELAMGKTLFNGGQGGGIGLEQLIGQHVAFNLHFAEYGTQGTGKVRDARRQGQVDQLDAGWHRQTGVADHQDVTMTEGGYNPGQGYVEQGGLFHDCNSTR